MGKNINIIISLFVLCLVFAPFASAVQTINIQAQDVGITIEYPKFSTIKQNEPFNLRFHAFNSTDGKVLTNETTNCTFNIYNHTGDNVLRMIPTFADLVEGDCSHCFEVNILKGNFTEINQYTYLIRCETEDEGGAISAGFEVTYDGTEATIQKVSVEMFLLLFCILLPFGFYFFRSKIDLEKLNNSIIRKYENKNYIKMVFSSISYNFLKNSFVIYYLFGLLILYAFSYLLYVYNLSILISIFEPIILIYTIGIILVGIFFLSYVQEWFMDLLDKVTNMDWGVEK
jgi:hypothetical protein